MFIQMALYEHDIPKMTPISEIVKTLIVRHIMAEGIVKSDLQRGARDSFQDWEMENWDYSDWEREFDELERQLDHIDIEESLVAITDEEAGLPVLLAKSVYTKGGEYVTLMVQGTLSEVITDIVAKEIGVLR